MLPYISGHWSVSSVTTTSEVCTSIVLLLQLKDIKQEVVEVSSSSIAMIPGFVKISLLC